MNTIAAVLGLNDLAINSLFATSKSIVAIQGELGKERWYILGGGEVETRRARARVALQGRTADVDTTDALQRTCET